VRRGLVHLAHAPGSEMDRPRASCVAVFIEPGLAAALMRMCGFRNVFVHEGTHVDAAVVAGILRTGVGDTVRFRDAAARWQRRGAGLRRDRSGELAAAGVYTLPRRGTSSGPAGASVRWKNGGPA